MADKTIGELPNLPAISPLDLLVAQHNEEATKITGATLTNFFKDYIGPVAATSASQMTNTNKVYIYIGNESGYTNGNWYYYNGSTWVSGGAYNSQAVNTDVTLTHEGVPADAEAAGKIVEISESQPAAPANRVWIPETQEATVQVPTWAEHQELNDAITNEKERVIMLADATQIAANTNFNTLTTYGNYYVAMTSEAATMPNIPIQRAGRLIVRATISDGTSYVGQIFIPYFGAMAYFRDTNNDGATWSNWETFSNLRGEIVEYLEPKMQASRAYATGSYLDYGGTLYKAKTAISNGDALTVGTNVDATTVCAELLTKLDKTFTKQTATINTTYLASGGLIEYYEIGNLVVVMGKDIAFSQVVPNSSEGNLINLIVGNLPASSDNNVFLATYMADLGNSRVTQRMRISPSGQLTVWWHTSVVTTYNTCFFTVIYKKA